MSTATLPIDTIARAAKGRAISTLTQDELNYYYMQGREREMLESLRNAILCRDNWLNLSDETPPTKFHQSLLELISVWANGVIPPRFLAAIRPIEQLAEKFLKHLEDNGVTDYLDKVPRHGFGDYLDHAMAPLRNMTEEPPRLESVAELLEQKVSPEQIAKMHGLSIVQVEAERDNPGSVCGPSYMPKTVRDRQKQETEDVFGYSNGAALWTAYGKLHHELGEAPSFPRRKGPERSNNTIETVRG